MSEREIRDFAWTPKRTWLRVTRSTNAEGVVVEDFEPITLNDERAMEAITTGHWELRPPAGISWPARTTVILEDAAKMQRERDDFQREIDKKREAEAKAERARVAAEKKAERERVAEEKRQAAAKKRADAEAAKLAKLAKGAKVLVSA
jgi:hypothetical protein